MKKITFIFLLLSTFCFGQETIKGEIILFDSNDKDLVAGKTYIYLRDNFHSEIATDSACIDMNLKFEFNNVLKDSVNLFFKPRNYPSNVSYNVKLYGDEEIWTKLKINYSPNCPFSKTNNICPKCNHSKNVVPVIYGLVLLKKSEAQKFKLGGCVSSDCDPNWFCKKHKLDF